ncbi:MAG TPA: arylsulfotransferase family protein [Solirubrobacterales bacterium]
MTGKTITAIALGLFATLSLPLSGCGDNRGTSSPDASITVEGLYPSFEPGQTQYVARCGSRAAGIRIEASHETSVSIDSTARRTGVIKAEPDVRPGEDFEIAVTGHDGRHTSYRVRCLPTDFPRWRFQQLRPVNPGLFVVAFRPTQDARPWVIVFDHQGVPRWWYSPDTRALWGQVLKDGTIAWARSLGDGYGSDPRMAYEVRSPSGELVRVVKTKGSIIDGHEFQELENGNVLVDSYAPAGRVDLKRFGGPARTSAVFAEIQEIDPAGRVIWRWNSHRHIHFSETRRWWNNVLSNGKAGVGGATTFDPVHLNSIEPRETDELVISTRHTDAIYGIARPTGDIRWKLGGTHTDESLRVIGDPARKRFGGQHDARIAPDGSLTVYDNGKDRPRRPRVVSYRLDPDRGTATYLGQLNDSRITTSHCCGSARPLIEGGWLVSWGDNPLVTGFDSDGQAAFRLELPTSTFRAVPVPEGATSVATLDRGMEAMER